MLDYNFYRIGACLAGHGHASAARGTWYESITTERETSFSQKSIIILFRLIAISEEFYVNIHILF